MKINVGIVATAATKKPSTKAVQKAKSVLKNANKAKADAVKEKLQAAIDQVVSLDRELDDTFKVYEAQIAKLFGQIAKLESKRDSTEAKTSGLIANIIPRITKLQDEYHLLGGKDIVPDSLKEYFTLRPGPSDAKPAKKSKKRPVAK